MTNDARSAAPAPRRASRRRRSARGAAGGAVAAFGLLAAGALGGAAAAQVAEPPQISETVIPRWTTSLTGAPDGGVWTIERLADWEAGYRAVRHAAAGASASASLSPAGGPVMNEIRSGLAPLADGSVAVVVANARQAGGSHVYDVALARVRAGSTTASFTRLPQPARRATGFAIAGDGTVWFGRACSDELYRRTPDGRLRRFALRRLGCRDSFPAPSTMTIGPDGSAWLVNLSQRRVARVDVRGRVREWRTDARTESYGPATLVADPRGGGAAFADGGNSGLGGRITPSGRYFSMNAPKNSVYAPGLAYEPGGALWHNVGGGLERVSSQGRTTLVSIAVAPDVADLALARDGAPWFLAGAFRWEGGSGGSGGWFERPVVGFADATGVLGTWLPAPPADAHHLVEVRGGEPGQDAELVLGPDGALWGTAVDFTTAHFSKAQLVRALPSGLAPARTARASVRRTLARSGRTVWLRLGCDADRGRFCRGTVALRGAAAPVRFVAAGATDTAVRVTLGRKAARKLRRSGVLRTTAVVRSGDATTRRALTLRAAARRR